MGKNYHGLSNDLKKLNLAPPFSYKEIILFDIKF
jgi:hypothetical protein